MEREGESDIERGVERDGESDLERGWRERERAI